MVYTRVNWEDLPSTNTPINAINLNKMDAGIKENDDKLTGAKGIENTIYANDFKCRNLYNNMPLTQGLWHDNGQLVTNSYGWYVVVPIEGGNTYTISKANAGTLFTATTATYPTNGVSVVDAWSGGDGQSLKTITTSSSAKYLFIALFAGSPTDAQKISVINALQVELGSTATSYTPHVGLVKEENGYVKENTTFYANDFKCRNLFNGSIITNLWVQSGTGNIITENNSNVQKIDCKAGETYTIKATFSSSSVDNIVLIAFYDNNGSLLQRTAEGSTHIITATAPANTAYMYAGHYIQKPTTIQLELGEATSYTPYKNFENEEVYSTNEIRIGTWINGKPIYRKVIDCGSLPNNTTKQIAHNISNIERTIKCTGSAQYGTYFLDLPYMAISNGSISGSNSIGITADTTNVNIITGSNRTSWSAYAILEYTKTTD